MVSLSGLLVDAASVGVSRLHDAPAGRMPAGHNGPWNDDVTPLRNTGHWSTLFFAAYDHTGDRRVLDAATDCVEYLCRDAARPEGYTFHHRDEPGKDRCNGLVGQGWSIEALAIADRYLDADTPRSIAEKVFCLHPFDTETGLWRTVEVDGTIGAPFGTINQQLWFAAAGSLLCRDGESPEVRRRVTCFLDGLPDLLRTDGRGLVYHSGYPYGDVQFLGQRVGARLWGDADRLDVLAAGYHSFTLYALAVLKRSLPDHPVWSSGLDEDLLAPVDGVPYRNAVANNVYAFDYNPTGIEVAFALETFRDERDTFWVDEQFRRCYDPATGLLSGGWDPETLSARLYQATRLTDREVTLPGNVATEEARSGRAARLLGRR